MKFDIVFVTYNSSKWIKNCFQSILHSDYSLKKLSIYVVDNCSQDNTLQLLEEIQKEYACEFENFVIIQSPKNLGFGQGNNLGFAQGKSPYVFFLNIDTEITKDIFKVLRDTIVGSDVHTSLWEARQFPYEHPKYYDPLTCETSWSSGAACVIKRDVFTRLAGFDKAFFMYAEDVDLSWRLRLLGHKIRYVPRAVVHHYSYSQAHEVKPVQYLNSIINHLLLRYKFGSLKDILKSQIMFFGLMLQKGPFEHARKRLLRRYIRHVRHLLPVLWWRLQHWQRLRQYQPATFIGWDYERVRPGAFHPHQIIVGASPKVSVVVRTCSRPNVLREALLSLRNQTYPHLEIQVIEDGANTAEKMIAEEFATLPIAYTATGKQVGRCQAGNIGLHNATGHYINFLDDDDVFFPDHIESLVSQLRQHPTYRASYSLAYETPIRVLSHDPYVYETLGHYVIYAQKFNRVMLCYHNYIPNLCMMFEKSIFLEEGGFDESLDVLEDWDLWVRYALKNDFLYTEKVTSMYRVPADPQIKEARQRKLDTALNIVREKHKNLSINLSVESVAEDLRTIINSYYMTISTETLSFMKANRPIALQILKKSMDIVQKMYKR